MKFITKVFVFLRIQNKTKQIFMISIKIEIIKNIILFLCKTMTLPSCFIAKQENKRGQEIEPKKNKIMKLTFKN